VPLNIAARNQGPACECGAFFVPMPRASEGFALPARLDDILVLQIILIKIIVRACSGRFAQRYRRHVS
jgi:hypothetical protein